MKIMKKLFFSILISIAFVSHAKAQFLFHAGPCVSYNHAPFFKAFRDAYNTENAYRMTNKLGNPSIGFGYQTGFSFRILHMQSSIGYSRFRSSTHASFENGAKRVIGYEYRNFIVNAGGFFDLGADQFSIELGMVASGTDQFSYLVLPNKEISYTGSVISQLNHWLNLGMDFRAGYDHALNDYLFWHTGLTYYFVNNEDEFTPGIQAFNTKATLTFKGFEFTTGLMLSLGTRLE
jgi:hypothetical protein